jgi:hypothetical protein
MRSASPTRVSTLELATTRCVKRVAVAACALVLSAMAPACGGEEDGRAAETRDTCIEEAQAEAGAAVVAGFYERGRLGSDQQVEREIRNISTPGFEPVSFLTPDGEMLVWREMSDGQQATFDAWKRTHRVRSVVEDAELRAVRDARERATETCPE